MAERADIPVTIPPVEEDKTSGEKSFFIFAKGGKMKVGTKGKPLKLTVRIDQTEFITRIPETNWFLEIAEDDR